MQQSSPMIAMQDMDSILAHKRRSLIDLVGVCYDALSSQSKSGNKGKTLRNFMKDIETANLLDEDTLKKMIITLVDITSTYRKTSFFQAAYGQTRSAKALFKAMKDDDLGFDDELQISKTIKEVLLNTTDDIKHLPATKIGQRLEEAKKSREDKPTVPLPEQGSAPRQP